MMFTTDKIEEVRGYAKTGGDTAGISHHGVYDGVYSTKIGSSVMRRRE